MDYRIEMEQLRLIASEVTTIDPDSVFRGKSIRASSSGKTTKPEFEGEFAKLSTQITLLVESLESEQPKDDDDPLFKVKMTFFGAFSLPAKQAEEIPESKEVEWDVAQRMANRMFPLMKSHAERTIQLMGAGHVELPWHLDVEAMMASGD